jgi:hypothetical protein
MKKVYLETFGCQMNVSDSERIKTHLQSGGYELTADEFYSTPVRCAKKPNTNYLRASAKYAV